LDIEAVGDGMTSDDGLRWLAEASCEASLIHQGADEAGTDGALGESFGHGAGELGVTVGHEHSGKLSHLGIEIDAPSSDFLEVQARLWAQGRETILELWAMSPFATLEESLDVCLVLDDLAAIPGAIVASDDLALEEDADLGVIGAKENGLADVGGRDGIGVAVELDASLLGDDERQAQIGVVRVLRELSQALPLDEESIGGPLASGGVGACRWRSGHARIGPGPAGRRATRRSGRRRKTGAGT
jgi:hypothetical protein